jgi:DNA-binding LytR/AlgR family response regulator
MYQEVDMKNKLIFHIENSNLLILDVNDILYFEKKERRVKIKLKRSQDEIEINTSIKNLCIYLSEVGVYDKIFFRPHCSFVVNINYIKILKHKNVILQNGYSIPISNNKKDEFLNKIEKQLENK